MSEFALSWVEISATAMRHNVGVFRRLVGNDRDLMVVVKANAYGHGMVPVARLALEAGASWLGVFHLGEALALRSAGIAAPLLVLGPTPAVGLADASAAHVHLTVADPASLDAVLAAPQWAARVHLKLETGTNRQGFTTEQLPQLARLVQAPHVVVEGAYTHFANIEDTTDHSYAMAQLGRFRESVARLAELGVRPRRLHTACSAATLLFQETLFDLTRVGIAAYGLWPSRETLVSARQAGREPVELQPVLSWKTRIAQLKEVPAGETVGYGRTHKTTRPSRLAVLPVGYANGYDRGLSNQAHVLCCGQRAKVCGRIMMNMCIVDVTDIGGARVGSEVVLLGSQGEERVAAEQLAQWLDTINYEVVTRLEPHGPRIVVA